MNGNGSSHDEPGERDTPRMTRAMRPYEAATRSAARRSTPEPGYPDRLGRERLRVPAVRGSPSMAPSTATPYGDARRRSAVRRPGVHRGQPGAAQYGGGQPAPRSPAAAAGAAAAARSPATGPSTAAGSPAGPATATATRCRRRAVPAAARPGRTRASCRRPYGAQPGPTPAHAVRPAHESTSARSTVRAADTTGRRLVGGASRYGYDPGEPTYGDSRYAAQPLRRERPRDAARASAAGTRGAETAERRRHAASAPAPAATTEDGERRRIDAAVAGAAAAAGGRVLPGRADPYVPAAGVLHPVQLDGGRPCWSATGCWSTRSCTTCATPERGEVVVFRGTDNWAPENSVEPAGGLCRRIGRTLGDLVGVSRPGEKDFIKRVIGLPGDRVSCCDPQGRVYVNGDGHRRAVHRRQLAAGRAAQPAGVRVAAVRRGRSCRRARSSSWATTGIVSQDSRCQGPVPIENVIGRAFVIVWPSGRWDTLSVPDTFADVPRPVALGRPESRPTAPSPAVGAASRHTAHSGHFGGIGAYGTEATMATTYASQVIDERASKPRSSFWRELPILLGVAILVAVLVRAFVLQTFFIPSESMEHTLNINDRVLVNKLVYDFRDPHRGEIVVFKAPTGLALRPDRGGLHQAGHRRRRRPRGLLRRPGPDHRQRQGAGRAVPLPGRHRRADVASEDAFDIVVPAGPAVGHGRPPVPVGRLAGAVHPPRATSSAATIPVDDVVGRAFVLFWPLGRGDWLTVPETFDQVPAARRQA